MNVCCYVISYICVRACLNDGDTIASNDGDTLALNSDTQAHNGDTQTYNGDETLALNA